MQACRNPAYLKQGWVIYCDKVWASSLPTLQEIEASTLQFEAPDAFH